MPDPDPPRSRMADLPLDLDWPLVLRVQTLGDRQAFAELVRRHQGLLRATLRRLCGGQAAWADELCQEAFLKAWQGLPAFAGRARFRTWLFRLAYNEFLQAARRSEQRLARNTQALDGAGLEAAADAGALPAGPADGLERHVALHLDLQRALQRLGDDERAAIVHCCMADFSHAEAAAVLGLPLGTVKTHVLRGRAKLQAALSGWATPTGETR